MLLDGVRRNFVNKAELIETVSLRLGGDKRQTASTVDAVLETITRSVVKGEKVVLTGFGVFEKRERAARTARNPATGESVKVKKTSVPRFRAGTNFKEYVSGTRRLAKQATPAKTTSAAPGRAGAAERAESAGVSGASATATAGRTTAGRATAGRATAARKPTGASAAVSSAAGTSATRTSARAAAGKAAAAPRPAGR
ncbi:MAG: HU family DNA-binding protein, partial [Actinomycetota bacterium]|nr:HU family DNA-binding protein [Actinomycetota bacterium]